MKVAIIGRTEMLYDTAVAIKEYGFEITCILTAKEAPEYERTSADFEALGLAWEVPFARGGKIAKHSDFLKKSQADIAVSINYVGVIPQQIIDLFPLGILNAHGGDLPRYRGNACQAWAILNGEEKIGLCIHKMIGGELDSGDIITRDYLKINHNTKITQVWEWMARQTPKLMLDAVCRLADDPNYVLATQSKNPQDALRCYPRKPEDGRIDWTLPAIDVLRLINASNKPYAGAFCEFEGQKMIIWDAVLVEDEEAFRAISGQVTEFGDGFVKVACGIGKLRLSLVEINGMVDKPSVWIQSIRRRLK